MVGDIILVLVLDWLNHLSASSLSLFCRAPDFGGQLLKVCFSLGTTHLPFLVFLHVPKLHIFATSKKKSHSEGPTLYQSKLKILSGQAQSSRCSLRKSVTGETLNRSPAEMTRLPLLVCTCKMRKLMFWIPCGQRCDNSYKHSYNSFILATRIVAWAQCMHDSTTAAGSRFCPFSF